MGIDPKQFYEMKARLERNTGRKVTDAEVSKCVAIVHPHEVDLTIKKSTDEERLNKTERAYLAYLRMLKYDPIGIQNITLKLADDCRLTPDFNFISASGRMTFVDVKGFQREDALIKMKVAARLYRWADFTIVKRAGTGWDVTEVKP